MFDWLEKYTPSSEVEAVDYRNRRVQLERITFDHTPASVSETAQWFLAMSVLFEQRTMVTLPASNEWLRNTIMTEIAPHFQDVKLVFIEGELGVVNMMHVKPESAFLRLDYLRTTMMAESSQ